MSLVRVMIRVLRSSPSVPNIVEAAEVKADDDAGVMGSDD